MKLNNKNIFINIIIINITMNVLVKRPKRCQMPECKKRLLLTDMICRCNKYFCGLHRLPEQHECQYDFKQESGDQDQCNAINAMKCVSDRVEKI